MNHSYYVARGDYGRGDPAVTDELRALWFTIGRTDPDRFEGASRYDGRTVVVLRDLFNPDPDKYGHCVFDVSAALSR